MWDRYPSLGTSITYDKRGALAVKSHHGSTEVFFPPRAQVSESESLFVSCPVGRMLANIGGREGITYPLRDRSVPAVERVSKSASSRELRLEIFISDSVIRNDNKLVWMQNDYKEAKKCGTLVRK